MGRTFVLHVVILGIRALWRAVLIHASSVLYAWGLRPEVRRMLDTQLNHSFAKNLPPAEEDKMTSFRNQAPAGFPPERMLVLTCLNDARRCLKQHEVVIRHGYA